MTTATQVQIRRGTGAQNNAATLASSEVVHDTTNSRLRVHDASRAGGWQIPNFSDIQKQAFQAPSVGGTGNAITLTNTVPLLSYSAPCRMVFVATAACTGAVTANVDGLGAKNIKKIKSGVLSALEAGDIISGMLCEITYDGTQFQISGLNDNSAGAGWQLLAVATGGGTSYDFIGDISSDFMNYAFVLENVLPVTNDVSLVIRVRRSGQGSFDSGASDYGWNITKVISLTGGTTTGSAWIGDSTNPYSQSALDVLNSANGGTGASGIVMVSGLGQAEYVQFTGEISHCDHTGVKVMNNTGSGVRWTTSVLDAVQFLFSSGSITSGKIFMYGLKSSL